MLLTFVRCGRRVWKLVCNRDQGLTEGGLSVPILVLELHPAPEVLQLPGWILPKSQLVKFVSKAIIFDIAIGNHPEHGGLLRVVRAVNFQKRKISLCSFGSAYFSWMHWRTTIVLSTQF